MPVVVLPTMMMICLHMGCRSGIFTLGYALLPPPSGSWGWQIARVHLPVGHEAASWNAAHPSVPEACATPAVFLAADMGVGVPMRGPQGVFIVARLVPSRLDSLWLSWWLMALLLRWRRRSLAALADLLMGFFTNLVVLARFVGFMSQVAMGSACSSSVYAELMSHRRGARRQAGVEVLLPRAAPIPKALPIGSAPALGTLGNTAQERLGGASFHDVVMLSVATNRKLQTRAAGARPSDILRPPRVQQWPRLAAWPLAQGSVTNCLPTQAWVSSQRHQGRAGARMLTRGRRMRASTNKAKEEKEAERPFASRAKGATCGAEVGVAELLLLTFYATTSTAAVRRRAISEVGVA